MIASTFVYAGVILAIVGTVCLVKPIARLRVRTRRRALGLVACGGIVAAAALLAPSFESHIGAPRTRHDEFGRVWRFHEVHTRRIAAPPERVYAAIKEVRADEILLFRALTWIRRGGRPLPPSLLNPGVDRPIVEVATQGGFILLADDPPRELVLGVVVARPPGARLPLNAELFRAAVPAGHALATMNFLVAADGRGGSIVSTETRVAAGGDAIERRFAAYWRTIYPGSALIRRMWLRAIARRSERSSSPSL